VIQLVLLNLDSNPVSDLYRYGLQGTKPGRKTRRRLESTTLAVSWKRHWIEESKRQMHLRDPEANLVTVFGIN
jgi:hypothetical protein